MTRQYRSCNELVNSSGATIYSIADQCWYDDNATMVLNGQSGSLVRDTAGAWRLEDDPGWKIERVNCAATGQPCSTSPDNDREYWKVTDQNGVQYFFGYVAAQNSTWTAPVFGLSHAASANPPCKTATSSTSWCVQAWRWNLDRIVDTNGNTTNLFWSTETNKYARHGAQSSVSTYVRGGWLDRIEYTTNSAASQTTVRTRVKFNVGDRCTAFASCPALTTANASSWPDVPVDLVCTGSSCTQYSPSFFTQKRLASIETELLEGATWSLIDRVTLTHEFPVQPDSTTKKLWLRSLQRTGFRDPATPGNSTGTVFPLIRFDSFSSYLANRADAYPWSLFRVDGIRDELGSQVRVTYFQQNPCTPIPNGQWATQTLDCYPAWATSTAGSGFVAFNKWLTKEVRVTDLVGGSPDMLTTYEYLGGAGWHYEDNPVATNRSHSDWRGYATVRIREIDTLSAAVPQPALSVSEERYFRGLNLDLNKPSPINVTDSSGNPYLDSNWMQGKLLESRVLTADASAEISSTRTGYWVQSTLTSSVAGYGPARYIRDAWTEDRVTGGDTARTDYTYDATYGVPTEINEQGSTTATGDERCTVNSYTVSTTAWLVLPKEVGLWGVLCAGRGQPSRLSALQYYYDNAADTTTGLNQAPTKGNLTRQKDALAFGVWAITSYVNDNWGRVTSETDPLLRTTSYGYDATYGYQRTVTNHLTHQTVTVNDPARGVPTTVTDPNGRITTYRYDHLGRVTKVWQPTEPTNGPASFEFVYAVDGWNGIAPTITTKRLQSGTTPANAVWLTNVDIHDGLGRIRENQTPSPADGRVIDATVYDPRGLVAREISAFHDPANSAGANLHTKTSVPASVIESRFTYDAAGRQLTETSMVAGVAESVATTSYAGRSELLDPPQGANQKRFMDVYGRLAKVEELNAANSAVEGTTTYVYDGEDQLLTTTDAAGNLATSTYDWGDRRTQLVDPDLGTVSYTYDLNGNQLTRTDATGTLAFEYDTLDRQIGEYIGTVAPANKIAGWAFDPANGKGLLASSTRWHNGNAYTTTITGYDTRNRATGKTHTIPANEGMLAGTYNYTYAYDAADHVVSITYPSVGATAAETVTTSYNAFGNTDRLIGTDVYVDASVYNNLSQIVERRFGAGGAYQVKRSYTWDRNRVASHKTEIQQPGGTVTYQTVEHESYFYDNANRVTRIVDQVSSQRRCYGYDHRHRLTQGWTTNVDCTDATSPNTAFGSFGYNRSYTYNTIGNLTSANGRAYSYPAAGSNRPHAVTAAGLDTFSYNNAGQMIGRSIAGVSTTLAYDETGWLETVTTGAATSTYKYDAGGNRIIRSEGATTTLFLDGIEATSTLGGQPVVSKYYAIGTSTVAVRVGGVLSWIANDVQGTPAAAVQAGSNVFSRQLYFPFGEVRGPSNQIPGNRGYIGQVEDDATQLVYLNARFYDPVLHRFVTPDPVSVGEEPQSLNPYTYAGNNPINATDPSGLWGWPKIKLPKIKVPKFLHTALDVAGMVPGIGEIADAANAALYLAEGDYTNAAISAAGMIPFGGAAATGGRLIAKGGREVAGAVTRRGARAGGEAIAEKTAKEAAGKSITEGTQRGTTEAAARSRKTGADSASCRANSFIPGTEVLLADGNQQAIETIDIGDLVLAADPVTGEQGPRTVVDLIDGYGIKLLVEITIDARAGPATVTATAGHPFWVTNRNSWVQAKDLATGDLLTTPTGTTRTITSLHHRIAHDQQVHNLTIADLHTYYTTAGNDHLLTHNCGAKTGPKPKGEGPHNLKVESEIKKLQDDGWTVHNGGTVAKEKVVKIDGGQKGSRRPDIYATKGNRERYINVGRTERRTGLPVRRERGAIADFAKAGIKIRFVRYD